MSQLQILNGDATLEVINKTSIPGRRMVWREVIAEGRVPASVGAEEFFAVRASFFESFFEIEEDIYLETTAEEFEKVRSFQAYDEITLWFEYDLFCQLNLMALLSWFASQELGLTQLYLVCVGEEEGYNKKVGLGEIDINHYPRLYEDKMLLCADDLKFAADFWQFFCSDNPLPLLELAAARKKKFPYLQAAVKAHLKRFPSVENGLNAIEGRMLEIVHSGVSKEKKVVGEMLKEDQIYGFGDLQYFAYLKNLYPLFNEGEQLELNELGEKVKSYQADFMSYATHDYYWGGTYFRDFRWNQEKDSLIRPSTPEE